MKKNRNWITSHLDDPYVKLAREQDYRARAAYKLKEIDEQQHLTRAGQVIVDLGSAPGSWSQYVQRKLGNKATIIALDLLDMEPVDGVTFFQGDFTELATQERLLALLNGHKVDLLLSDMAPNLSGIAAADAARMDDLLENVQIFASQFLQENGSVVAKCFQGSRFSQIVQRMKLQFKVVKTLKPAASRAKSAEVFLFACGLKSKQETGRR